jgi:hypothetical protein
MAFDIALAWQKNVIPRILIIRKMTFEFEYLGEFEFIFESINQGTRSILFMTKNGSPKSRASVPLMYSTAAL